MKKISFVGNFNDPGFEGLVSISLKLKKHLEGRGYRIALNNLNSDVLHVHSNGFLEAWKYRKYGGKIVYSLYSNLNQSFFGTLRYYFEYLTKYYDKRDSDFPVNVVLKNAFFSLLSSLIPLSVKRKILSKMRLVVLPNKYMWKKLKLKNSVVIPFGTDVAKFTLRKKENKNFRVAYFGHNTPLKGIPDFLSAAKILNKKKIEFCMYISNYSDNVRKRAKKYNSQIKVSGFVEDIVKAYNECDVIVVPYRSDVASVGVPLVLIEAMSCGKTVITSNLEYVKEVVGSSGICVNAYSPKKIAKWILKLKNEEKLRVILGEKARKRIVENYNINSFFKKYDDLYSNLPVLK